MLTIEQPVEIRHVILECRVCSQRIDRQRRGPGRQIRVDGPAAVRANRLAQEAKRCLRHAMLDAAGRREAHGHETRQRYRLQIAAAVGLHSLQHAQARIDRRAPHQTCQRETRPAMHVARLSDRHECRNRVADHRQPCPTIEPLRHACPLERQRRDLRPVDQPGQRAVGENRYGECLVGAVARAETVDAAFPLQVGPGPIQWTLADERPVGPGETRRRPASSWRYSNGFCPYLPSLRRRSAAVQDRQSRALPAGNPQEPRETGLAKTSETRWPGH